jgi:hypothetical protein
LTYLALLEDLDGIFDFRFAVGWPETSSWKGRDSPPQNHSEQNWNNVMKAKMTQDRGRPDELSLAPTSAEG